MDEQTGLGVKPLTVTKHTKYTEGKYLNYVHNFSATVPDFKFLHISFHVFCDSHCTHLQKKTSIPPFQCNLSWFLTWHSYFNHKRLCLKITQRTNQCLLKKQNDQFR